MPKEYDLAKAVADFRRAIQQRDAATTLAERCKHDAEATRLREAYKDWNGDDELFEIAFGEPFDEHGDTTG